MGRPFVELNFLTDVIHAAEQIKPF